MTMNTEEVNIEPAVVTKSSVVTKIQISVPQFVLNATSMDVYVSMFADNNLFVEGRTVHIPENVYKEWGKDDNYIVHYVLSQLHFTTLNEIV